MAPHAVSLASLGQLKAVLLLMCPEDSDPSKRTPPPPIQPKTPKAVHVEASSRVGAHGTGCFCGASRDFRV